MSQPGVHRGLVTMSVMLATVLQVLDTTIANVALPNMQGSLSATQDQISWVLTSYMVATAVMMPPTGFLAARFGRKRLYATAVAGFTVTSMLCGAAQSLEQMVLFRILQGAFGAPLVPLSQSLLLDTYPRERHGYAMALWGVGIMVGPILGPTLGGWLTEYYNWRWVFYINLPIGILAWFGIVAFVGETPLDRKRRFDWLGFALLTIALGAFQLMLDRGEQQDWFTSAEILAEAWIAAGSFLLFLAHTLTTDEPFIHPAMFRDRNLVTGLVFIFAVGLILLATLALLPPFLQHLLGYPVLDIGILLAPRGVGTMAAMILVGRLSGKVDPRLQLGFGFAVSALSLWQMAQFTADVSASDIVLTGLVQGFGLGFLFPPLSVLAFATLAPQWRTEAAGMFSLVRNIGSSIGISVVIALLSRNTQINHAELAQFITPYNPLLQPPWLPAAWDPSSAAGLASLDGEITRQAVLIAYLNDFRLMMYVALVAIPLLPLLRKPRPA